MTPRRLRRDSPVVAGDGIPPSVPTTDPIPCTSRERNRDFPWDKFDSQWYYEHNYKTLRDDDLQIIHAVRDFFATLDPSSHRSGIDVGSGTNLYPALTMLPLCHEITLYEYSTSNISWLRREIQFYSSSWDAFWKPLAVEPLYKSVESPRETLAAVARVEKGNIFDLPKAQWDIGTMFFAAESISATLSEFQTALGNFIASLRTGAPFAAAFMEDSLGYSVGTHRFPAVAIAAKDVKKYLTAHTDDLEVHRVDLTKKPLRDGYGGMIVATGKIT